MLQGPDVSRWQTVNWQVLAPHIDCAIVKSTGADAGYYVDSKYYYNRDNLRAIGKPRGWYHFAGASDPVAEANFFVDNTDWQPGEYLVLDREAPWPADVPGWSYRFLLQVKNRRPQAPLAIYMSGSRVTAYDWSGVLSLGAEIWIAAYGTNSGRQEYIPNAGQWGSMWAHQFTSLFPLPPGIQSGGLDWNYFYRWGEGLSGEGSGEAIMAKLDDEDRAWLAGQFQAYTDPNRLLGATMGFAGIGRSVADWIGGANVNSWLSAMSIPFIFRMTDQPYSFAWWAVTADGKSRYWLTDIGQADLITGGMASKSLVPVHDLPSWLGLVSGLKQYGPTPPSWFVGSAENPKNAKGHIYSLVTYKGVQMVVPQMNPEQFLRAPGFSGAAAPAQTLADDNPIWDLPRYRVFRDAATGGIYIAQVNNDDEILNNIKQHLSPQDYTDLGFPAWEDAGADLIALPDGTVLPVITDTDTGNSVDTPSAPNGTVVDWNGVISRIEAAAARGGETGGLRGATDGTSNLGINISLKKES